MKTLNLVVATLALSLATLVATPIPAVAAPAECTPAGDCTKYKHRVTFPAHALSYGPAANFALHPRGVDWLNATGSLTLTVRRPLHFNGKKVRLTLVHQTASAGGDEGSLIFPVTAIAFRHGSGFETYGGFFSDTLNVPGDPTGLYEQSVVVESGQGWSPDGPWWYFQFNRQGTYVDKVRVMAVVLEY